MENQRMQGAILDRKLQLQNANLKESRPFVMGALRGWVGECGTRFSPSRIFYSLTDSNFRGFFCVD